MRYLFMLCAIVMCLSGCSSKGGSVSSEAGDTAVGTETSSAQVAVKCPQGNTDSIIPIIYGLPTKETMERAERGEVALGGCIQDSAAPLYHCKIHDVDF